MGKYPTEGTGVCDTQMLMYTFVDKNLCPETYSRSDTIHCDDMVKIPYATMQLRNVCDRGRHVARIIRSILGKTPPEDRRV